MLKGQGLGGTFNQQTDSVFLVYMSNSDTVKMSGEGFVVTEGGVRKDGQVYTSEAAAQADAEKRKKKLQEQAGSAPAPAVEVKRQIFG